MEERCNMIHSSGKDASNSGSVSAEVKDTAASTSTIAVEDKAASASNIVEDMAASTSTIFAEDTAASTSNIVEDMAASTSTIAAKDTAASTSNVVKDTAASISTIAVKDTAASTSNIVKDTAASTKMVVVPHAEVLPVPTCPPSIPIDFHPEIWLSDDDCLVDPLEKEYASIISQNFSAQTIRGVPGYGEPSMPEGGVDDMSMREALMLEELRDENRGRNWEEVIEESESDGYDDS